jgi:Raf kinase inhibitor-like YbhB/YbcL family protein
MRMTMVNVLMVLMSLISGAQKAAAQQKSAAQQPATTAPPAFEMTSVYYDGDWIPVQYTCEVSDSLSPRVQWTGAPSGTMSFALIFHDPDAAPAKGAMDVTHWILWNIPASATELRPGVQPDTSPDGIQQGKSVRGANGYQPPCPPVGTRPHHYIFELYALDAKVDLPAGSTRADLLKAMDGHVLGKASLVGIFGQKIDDKTWHWDLAKLP